MFASLKDFLDTLMPETDTGAATDERSLQLATAVLLVEVMRSNSELAPAEQQVVIEGLRQEFGLNDAAGQELLALARRTAEHATDYYEYTSRINDAYDMPDKLRMIELMWKVAYADGKLDAHENHVMRKIADLLYIPQGAYVNAKMRARDASPAAGHDPLQP